MATQQINIQINSTGTLTVVRNLNQIAGAASNAINPITRLERVLRAAFVSLGVKQVLDYADAWTAATNKVAVFTSSQGEANAIMEELFNVALRVRQPLNELVGLYQRITIASKELNITAADNIAFTEGIGKALAVQGTSATQARGALLQLSQAMGEGIIRAQEFNSMVENMPLVLQLVAQELQGASGSISTLRSRMLDGKLTSKEFYEAFTRAQPQLDAMFAKSEKTFGQAFVTFETGLIRFLGQLNQATGASNKFYSAVEFIVANLDSIGKALGVAAAGAIAFFAPAIVTAFANALGLAAVAVGRLTLLLLANPFTAIALAVASVIAFGDSWDAGIDGVTTVRDLLIAVVNLLSGAFTAAFDFIAGAWVTIQEGAQFAFEAVTGIVTGSVGTWFGSYEGFFSDVGTGFAGMLRSIARIMDAIAGLITGTAIAIGRIFGGLPAVMKTIFGQVYNEIAGWMERAANVVIAGINKIRTAVGLGVIDAVKFDRIAVDEKVFQDYGKNISNSINDGFQVQGGYMQKKVEELIGNAQQLAYKRLANRPGAANLNQPTAPIERIAPVDKAAADAAKKLADELKGLLGRIDSVRAAQMDLADGVRVLNAAQAAGLITDKERGSYIIALARYYQDLIDPVGAVVRGLEEENQIMKLNAREYERETRFREIQKDLLRDNITLTAEEVVSIRAKIAANQALSEAMRIQDGLLEESVDKRRKFLVVLEQIAALQANPQSGFTANDATAALQDATPDLFVGTQEAMDLQLDMFRNMYLQIDQMRSLNLVSEETASMMRLKVAARETELRTASYSQMFGNLASLATSSNRKIAAIGKAAAVTQATIDGVLAVQKALASAPYPINLAMAAAVGVSAASNVAKILSSNANFATGGEFTIGGSGGVDSQVVAFRGSPGEKVSVSTPEQVRKGTATKEGGGGGSMGMQPMLNVKTVNVLDPALIGDYLATDEGEIMVMNIIQRNKSSM